MGDKPNKEWLYKINQGIQEAIPTLCPEDCDNTTRQCGDCRIGQALEKIRAGRDTLCDVAGIQ